MNSAPLPPDLIEKIAHARALADRPVEDRFARPSTISEILRQRAAEQPDAPFLTFVDDDGWTRSESYAEFYRSVQEEAADLAGSHLRAGERIVLAAHNHDWTIQQYFAAWHLGACVVPLNMGEDDKRLSHIIQHSEPKVVIALSDYEKRIRGLLKALNYRGELIILHPTRTRPEKISACSSLPDLHPASPDDEALIVYTSGTTGVPKGVVLSHYNLVADAHAISAWHRFTPQTRLMCVLPVHHVNGLIVTHVTPVFCGGSVVLNRKFSAHRFFQTVAAHGVEVVSVVPTLLQFLLEATPSDVDARAVAPTLKYLICGAGPLTVDLAARFEDRFRIPICHGYGLSETTCYSCFMPVDPSDADALPSHSAHSAHSAHSSRSTHSAHSAYSEHSAHSAHSARPGPHPLEPESRLSWMRGHGHPSIGVPVATNGMAIYDENGGPQPEGVKGEIVIRGHNVMLGYHNNPTANASAFTHGWFRSGDEGFFKTGRDGRRYFFISGRFKELIIRGGVKISPLEIDEVLNRAPGVKAAMAVGFENVTYGEEVGAYVVKCPGADVDVEVDVDAAAAAVLAHCRAELPFSMCPKVVVFGEDFPVTSTGKYQRNSLKPLFEAHRTTQFREPPPPPPIR